jgi:hypothetical protein
MTEAAAEDPGTDLVPFDPSDGDHIQEMRVGKTAHILKYVAQCNTCANPYRLQIEEWALTQRIPWIHEQLLSMVNGREDLVPSYQSIRRHYIYGHSSAAAYLNQKIIDDTAAALGKKIDETAQQRIDVLSLATKVVDIRGRLFYSGEDIPSDTILVKSMDMIRAQDANSGGSLDNAAFLSVINRIMAYANDHVTDRTAFTEALLADPVLSEFDRVMRGVPAVEGQ